MGAGSIDREEFVTATRKQNGMPADVPQQHLAIGNRVGCSTQCQIGTGRFRIVTAHVNLPLPRNL
jgi:hypothetical protein